MAASLLPTGDEKENITYFFSRGYQYDAIEHFLAKFHDITMSIRPLKNRLRRYQLRRRTPTCDLNLVREAILRELSGPGCSGGDRSMWHILHLHNIQVPRHVVKNLMREFDPDGCEQRRSRALQRRRYSSPRPNHTWHVDGLDALIMRFETPDSRNRWDSPLFVIQVEDVLPFDSIYEALINRVPPPPNQATQAQPLSATNFLYELDKTTQDIVTALLNSQSTFVPGDSVAVPGAQEKISLKKSIALSILCEYLTVPQECQGNSEHVGIEETQATVYNLHQNAPSGGYKENS
ncbi:Protein KTI12-like protein [Acropora cervicornis]|uniref:Protein KTI12 homolog n=1 Tax=Acropora cervicornis TaxID=6130 RepID=A0AAD9QQD3_ACRCE|nr:Protein KTI12-like protein [Acropora cervicornis]